MLIERVPPRSVSEKPEHAPRNERVENLEILLEFRIPNSGFSIANVVVRRLLRLMVQTRSISRAT